MTNKHRQLFVLVAFAILLSDVTSIADEPLPMTLAVPLVEGTSEIILRLSEDIPQGFRVNAFVEENEIVTSVSIGMDSLIRLYLLRPLKAGEQVQINADVQVKEIAVRKTVMSFYVGNRFSSHLRNLRSRVDVMWPVFQENWAKAYLQGELYLRYRFDWLPFVTFPDEAPEILVEEFDGRAKVFVSEVLGEEWSLYLASGIPVELTETVWDDALGAYTGKSGFDSVYLVSNQSVDRMSITIVYQRSDQFLASYPIVEWIEPNVEDPLAFNCYGFGTTRSFGGGMYAIVGNGAAWYAEYNEQGLLDNFADLVGECSYDIHQNLISGKEKEESAFMFSIW